MVRTKATDGHWVKVNKTTWPLENKNHENLAISKSSQKPQLSCLKHCLCKVTKTMMADV